jgi:hypothetical protein
MVRAQTAWAWFNSPPDEEVIQLKHFRDYRNRSVVTSPAALRGGRPLLVRRGVLATTPDISRLGGEL